MKTTMRYMLVALSVTVAAPAIAAPLTPTERTTVEARELHDFRDVQKESYNQHTARNTESHDAYASVRSFFEDPAPAKSVAQPVDRLTIY